MNGDEVRILTVHPGALGDCILFGHLLKRLDGEVTLLTGSERGKLLTGMEVIDRAVDFDSAPMHELFSDVPLDACHLPRLLGRYDRLISCFGGGDRRGEQRLAAMCGAKSAAFLPVRPPPGAQGHLLEIWSELLGLDPPGLLRSDPWVVPEISRINGRNSLGELGIRDGCGFAVLHPGAGSPTKCFPLGKYLDLADRIEMERVLFVIGPVEADLWSSEDIARISERFPVLTEPTLDVLAGILSKASLFIGNDSGPSHLAAAVGCPTVCLFGPTSPEAFSPLGARVETVREEQIEDISNERILEAVRDLRG